MKIEFVVKIRLSTMEEAACKVITELDELDASSAIELNCDMSNPLPQ